MGLAQILMCSVAGIAQLGERQTEDLKVACSIHAHRNNSAFCFFCPIGSDFFFPLSALKTTDRATAGATFRVRVWSVN